MKIDKGPTPVTNSGASTAFQPSAITVKSDRPFAVLKFEKKQFVRVMNLKVGCSLGFMANSCFFGFGARCINQLAGARGGGRVHTVRRRRQKESWSRVQWTWLYLTCDCGVLPPFPTRIWHLLGLVVPLLFLDLLQNP
jgi:hypothetical protein